MTRPDLETAEGRATYKRELSGVAQEGRWLGVLLICLSPVGIFSANALGGLGSGGGALVALAAFACLPAGILVLYVGIVRRTFYHLKRMAEPAAVRPDLPDLEEEEDWEEYPDA